MIVTPIAHTVMVSVPESVVDTPFAQRQDGFFDDAGIDRLHEFAGRACYKSWDMPNPKTADNAGYMSNILDVGHFSITEHGQVTFYVEHVSRSLLLELERHQRNSHLSFSVESQRYVDTSKAHADAVIPPLYRDNPSLHSQAILLQKHYEKSLNQYDAAYQAARDAGFPIKVAREAARAFLPNATPVDFVVTADIRGWREVIEKRNYQGADAEIREFAAEILKHLRNLAPNSVADIPDEPYQ